MQRYEKAIEDYTKAIEIDANIKEAYNNREIALKAFQVNEN